MVGPFVFRENVQTQNHVPFPRQTGKTLWQISFFDHILRTAEDLSETTEYILLNPVRAGLVQRPRDYPYSQILRESR
jgi:REP element-mobilizing transposase RayT